METVLLVILVVGVACLVFAVVYAKILDRRIGHEMRMRALERDARIQLAIDELVVDFAKRRQGR